MHFKNVYFTIAMTFILSACSGMRKAHMDSIPKTTKESYSKQIGPIVNEAVKLLSADGKLAFKKDEISSAPMVANIDFQSDLKTEVNRSNLAEDRSWWSLPHGRWGFEYSVNKADRSLTKLMTKNYGKPMKLTPEANKLKASSVDFPLSRVNLNANLPSHKDTVIANESPAFDASDALEVAQADLTGEEGVVFFPFVNLSFKKQGITINNVDGEKVLNYQAAINGYFVLCNAKKCVTAKFPSGKGVQFIMPLVSLAETEKDNQQELQKFAQDFLSNIIAQVSYKALKKLSTVQ